MCDWVLLMLCCYVSVSVPNVTLSTYPFCLIQSALCSISDVMQWLLLPQFSATAPYHWNMQKNSVLASHRKHTPLQLQRPVSNHCSRNLWFHVLIIIFFIWIPCLLQSVRRHSVTVVSIALEAYRRYFQWSSAFYSQSQGLMLSGGCCWVS